MGIDVSPQFISLRSFIGGVRDDGIVPVFESSLSLDRCFELSKWAPRWSLPCRASLAKPRILAQLLSCQVRALAAFKAAVIFYAAAAAVAAVLLLQLLQLLQLLLLLLLLLLPIHQRPLSHSPCAGHVQAFQGPNGRRWRCRRLRMTASSWPDGTPGTPDPLMLGCETEDNPLMRLLCVPG